MEDTSPALIDLDDSARAREVMYSALSGTQAASASPEVSALLRTLVRVDALDERRECRPSADDLTARELAFLVDLRDAAEFMVSCAAPHARKAGRSWSEIAAILGTTRQAAQQRYGKHVK